MRFSQARGISATHYPSHRFKKRLILLAHPRVSAGEKLSPIGNDGGTYTLNIVELSV